MKVKMLSIDAQKLQSFDFENFGDGWYRKKIPQNFRGEYTLHISADNIYGIFHGMAVQELELNEFIDKLTFRSPHAAEAVKKLLSDMKEHGAVEYDEAK